MVRIWVKLCENSTQFHPIGWNFWVKSGGIGWNCVNGDEIVVKAGEIVVKAGEIVVKAPLRGAGGEAVGG